VAGWRRSSVEIRFSSESGSYIERDVTRFPSAAGSSFKRAGNHEKLFDFK
jgi:hypothetical protein